MLKISLRFLKHALKLLRRFFFGILLVLALISSGLILSLRYSVLPEIGRYHADIEKLVTESIGQSVEIGKIEADWLGIGPHLRLTDIRILDKQMRTSLALQRVDVVVSWMTLLTGQLRLDSLEIDQPDLLVKRDMNGIVSISGVHLEGGSTDNNFANLLLSQSRIVVRGAHISWRDELQHKPILVFDDVNLLLENKWNHHRFAMRGLPPAELATKLDVRGDFSGKNFDDMQSWKGEVFAQLDYADLAAWKVWLPFPAHFKQGNGALRGWLGISKGNISQVTADLALLNVQTRLGNDLPPLDIRVLSGRMGWQNLNEGFEISLSKLSLKLFDGFLLKPTDIYVSLKNLKKDGPASGDVRANLIELEGVAKLMEYMPLDRKVKEQFAEYLPQGKIENFKALWQTDNDKQLHYKVKGKFLNLSLQRVGKIPGFSGLSGEIDGNEVRGVVSVNSNRLKVDAPLFMPEELAFDSIAAQAVWQSNSRGMEVILRSFTASNADIAGTAYGSYQTLEGSPGKIDLNVHMTRASVKHAERYIPLIALGENTRTWLSQSLIDGESNDFNLRLKGALNDFPYADNRKGIFKINGRINGVTLKYDPDWPKIENGRAELLMLGRELSVVATTAQTAEIPLQNVMVTIPDVLSKDLRLNINGEAKATNKQALAYIKSSPVRGFLGGLTDDFTAGGNGLLKLKLDIPLQEIQKVKVEGNYHFTDSELGLSHYLPVIRQVNGDLSFTESGVSTQNITAQILGGPAKLMIASDPDGKISVNVNGHANFTELNKVNPLPVLNKISGDADWNVSVDVKGKNSKILFTSSLLGFNSDLPAPLSKRANESIPLRIEINDLAKGRKAVTVKYGSVLNANLQQQKDDDASWHIEKGIVNFGNMVQKADREGLWVIGTLPQVSVEGWDVLSSLIDSGDDSGDIRIAGADFSIQKLSGYGNLVQDLHIKASTRSNIFTAQMSSKEMNGDLNWRYSSGRAGDYGRIYMRFKNLDLGLDNNYVPGIKVSKASLEPENSGVTELPFVDLTIDRLSNKGRELGKLEFHGQQHEQSFLLNHLRLSNADGVMKVDGKWLQSEEAAAKTEMNLKLDINNAGNFLARLGYPDSLKNGNGKMEGAFSWQGEPWAYDKARLNGKLSLETEKGRFLQIDPGAGKLLSILSLQALPKRITLDFDDVFSNGFEFDSIKGNADIKDGVLSTDNLRIEGSAAKVFMAGQMDLAKEEQDLRVRIVPTVGNSAALISALVATPIMGAYVYLASKVFNDPLGQLVSFEYKINGSWSDPKVEKIGEKKKPEAAEIK